MLFVDTDPTQLEPDSCSGNDRKELMTATDSTPTANGTTSPQLSAGAHEAFPTRCCGLRKKASKLMRRPSGEAQRELSSKRTDALASPTIKTKKKKTAVNPALYHKSSESLQNWDARQKRDKTSPYIKPSDRDDAHLGPYNGHEEPLTPLLSDT